MKKQTKLALMLSAMMMIGSVNVYAAEAAPNQSKANTAKQAAAQKNTSVSIDGQIEEWSKKLKPGEVAAYYIANQSGNPLDRIQFISKGFVYDNYEEFLGKAEVMLAPSPTKPDTLPSGYQYKSAILYLENPAKTSDVYQKLEKQLKAEASKGNKKVYFSKPFKADKADTALLSYEKGKVKLDVVATHIQRSEPIGGTPVPIDNPDVTTETIVIHGVECTYTNNKKGRDYLEWIDEDHQVRYTIWAESAKWDVLSFAKKMLAE
ncbi:hypothetical protein JCM10914A_49800 [Paenibacillus sp. JCM 10914]|uniref:hypothetical protein n=1 Tax=Paenibacillus sp. JCM 10914 TaxID=1236974 RepID=UPI0003CC9F94|nr:hypothetical protein [Paenibacillus sp. JCM 10914]GAE08891.1 hypothetical protein JCM10914_5227 [Paenibacillus sp. JCM 10914]